MVDVKYCRFEAMNPQPRGATPRALARPSSQHQQQRRQYTAVDIDQEIAADDDDDSDNEDSESRKSDADSTCGDDDDEETNQAYNVEQKKKGKRQPPTKATPKKRTSKSGYKPITEKPIMKPSKQTKSPRKKKRLESSSDDDDDECDEEYEEEEETSNEENESEEEEEEESDYGKSSKKTSSRGKKKGSRGGKSGTIRSPTRSTTNIRSSSARSSRRRSQRHLSNSYSSSSDDDDDSYEGTSGGGKGRGRPRRTCKTQTELRMSEMVHKDMQSEKEAWRGVLEDDDRELLGMEDDDVGDVDDDDDDDDEVISNGRGNLVDEDEEMAPSCAATNKRRASPQKGSKRIGIHNDDDDDEDYDDAPSDANDGEDDDEDDDEIVSDDEIIFKQNKRRSSRNRRSTKNVDLSEEEIGTADEDSADEETGPGILMSPTRKASVSRIGGRCPNASRTRANARMGRKPLDVEDDEDEDENDSRGHVNQYTTPHSATSLLSRKTSKELTMACHINCPSTTDEITMANLPKNKPHVCYISPDGRTRRCFALDTLYRIAISAISNRTGGGSGINEYIIGSAQKITFLQPPHFRSPMEDDLLDQIASRFGRAALNIEKSAIYKRMHGSIFSLNDDDELDDFDEDGEFIGYGNSSHSSRRGTFQDRFERYIQNLMGSNDVYCCPLCYNEADRRLGNMGDDEMWEDDADDDDEDETEEGHKHSGEECFSFMDDPMRILGNLDHDQYEIASTFCFRTLVDVKTHLKVVHQVNIKEVAGNDLYHRFQIRASDGLLQSWLKRNLGHSTVQGDMMRYWNQGENQSFVLLLSQIDKGQFEGEITGEFGGDFCQSFPNRARRIWREVSSPYSKYEHDISDFIAVEGEEEGEEEEESVVNDGPANLHASSSLTPEVAHGEEGSMKSPEDQIIEFLQKKQKSNRQKQSFYKRKDNSSKKNANSSDESSDDDDELEVLPKPQQYEEMEEEDEWTKSKTLKAKKGKKSMKSSRSSDEDSCDASVFDSDVEIVNIETNVNGSARKRVIDDDDSLGPDAARKPNHSSPVKHGGSARKKVIESSDEESF